MGREIAEIFPFISKEKRLLFFYSSSQSSVKLMNEQGIPSLAFYFSVSPLYTFAFSHLDNFGEVMLSTRINGPLHLSPRSCWSLQLSRERWRGTQRESRQDQTPEPSAEQKQEGKLRAGERAAWREKRGRVPGRVKQFRIYICGFKKKGNT